MKRILDIGHNDLRLFLKRPSSWVWLFLVPLVFIVMTSFAARGPGAPGNRVPPVIIENLDTGFMGEAFITELSAHGLWRVDPAKGEKAERGIRIPENFSEQILAGHQVKPLLYTIEGSDSADAAIIEARLIRALVTFNSDLVEARTRPGASGVITAEDLKTMRERPDRVTLAASFAGRQPTPTGFGFSLPGNLVMYVMMNLLIFGGSSIAAARRAGVLRRLMSMPVRRRELVAGSVYGLFLLGLVQVVVFLALGKFAFGVNLGANLPGVFLVLAVYAWVAAGLGVFIGSVLSAHDRIIGVCVLSSLLMAAIGGCWWPLESVGTFGQRLALCVPSGWALAALHQMISFGSGLDAIVVPLLVLGVFGLAANLAAAKWFRV